MSDDKLGTCPSENYGHTLQFCRARHAISSPAWQPLPAQPAAPKPRCQFVRQCELEDGHNGWHKHGNDWWQPPAPNVTTAPEEAAARETQSAEPTVEDTLRIIRKMEQCTGDTAKVLLIKNLFRRFASAREAQIAELLARLDAIADLATTDSGPVQPRPQDKVQK